MWYDFRFKWRQTQWIEMGTARFLVWNETVVVQTAAWLLWWLRNQLVPAIAGCNIRNRCIEDVSFTLGDAHSSSPNVDGSCNQCSILWPIAVNTVVTALLGKVIEKPCTRQSSTLGSTYLPIYNLNFCKKWFDRIIFKISLVWNRKSISSCDMGYKQVYTMDKN